ncbi:MAG: NRDE family protein [Halioglobus sp.]|nr:NRDE family protein [Halioglobus sp.]
MCLVILAHGASARYPLVVAANRDEFHARATAASRFWRDQPGLLAGQDLELGGTWMGVTRAGRFAAVTNFRDPARTSPAPRSRGELPLDFLLGDESPRDYLAAVAGRATEYAGFNLLAGADGELWYLDNADRESPQPLPPGIYGLSNARLDTPWPKVVAGTEKLTRLLQHGEVDHDKLAAVVGDRALADPLALQSQRLHGEMDHLLSAQFIVTPGYGTRSTTTLCIDDNGLASWREQSFDSDGNVSAVNEYDFNVARPRP